MPASTRIVRRSGARRLAHLGVPALLVLACSSAPAAVERPAPSPPAPLDLRPEAGTLRTTVDGTARGDGSDTPDDDPDEVVLVGDSVLVLVADDLASRVSSTLHVDAADCRRIDEPITGPCGGIPAGTVVPGGIEALRAALDTVAGTADAAVFVLANNSTVTADHVRAVIDAAGDIPHLWFVNTRIVGFGRQDLNNAVLQEVAAADPRVGVVDWFTASEGRDWLVDNVHPGEDGQAALAGLIEDRLECRCTA